jgi:hypothetical protein
MPNAWPKSRNGARTDVMPFDLKATTHIFTKTAEGGTQRVAVKNVSDAVQTRLVLEHLRDILIAYQDIGGGAELAYRSKDAKLVAALHAWVDAQVCDHDADAMAGHQHHRGDMPNQ